MEGCPVVDTHVHLSDRRRWPDPPAYKWHNISPRLDDDFNVAMFEAEKPAAVGRTIFMECMGCNDWGLKEAEAKWACGLAAKGVAGLCGVVAGCPLGHEDVPRVQQFLDAVAHPRLVGVRTLLQGEPEKFGASACYVAGCREVAARGLAIDLCLKGPGQLADALALVDAVPEGRFVIDHIGKPDIAKVAGVLDEKWIAGMEHLAAKSNVWCKVSGMVTEVEGYEWSAEVLEPYLVIVVRLFGWNRIMFGSDWYASKLATRHYSEWFSTLQALPTVQAATDEQRAKLFAYNAEAFYHLENSCSGDGARPQQPLSP